MPIQEFKDSHKHAEKWLFMDTWKLSKIGKIGEFMKNYFPAFDIF